MPPPKIDLAKILDFEENDMGFGGFVRGPVMDTRRSYYLQPNQDHFSEPDGARCGGFDTSDIPWVIPANDNAPTKVRLAARCRALFRRLIVLHSLR
jgi:hypothetical protein